MSGPSVHIAGDSPSPMSEPGRLRLSPCYARRKQCLMFADPQTVTINAIANTLNRTAFGTDSGSFSKDDRNVQLKISHSYTGSRVRRLVRIDHRKIAADPLVATQNLNYQMNAYLVMDVPLIGYTVAEAKQPVDGLLTWLTATSGANITKLLGGES